MEISIKNAINNLQNNGFHVVYVSTKQDAQDWLEKNVVENIIVGKGGSITCDEVALTDIMRRKNNTVLDHNIKGLSQDEILSIRIKQLSCDVFFCSSNAITEDGKLYNVDGVGNRVAAMIFGPKKVIIIAGINKVVKNLEEAKKRVKQIAAPKNNQRLHTKNPCVVTGCCVECNLASRICNITSIIEKRPIKTEYIVILIGENLGY